MFRLLALHVALARKGWGEEAGGFLDGSVVLLINDADNENSNNVVGVCISGRK